MAKKLEQLQVQLSKFGVEFSEDSDEQFLPLIKKLPAKLKTIAFAVLYRDPKGRRIYDIDDKDEAAKAREKLQTDRRQLDKLAVRERTQIFAVLLPKLANHLEAAWQNLKLAPYGNRYTSKAFRAPKNAAVTFESRVEWLSSFLGAIGEYDRQVVDAVWLAQWAGYALHYYAGSVAPILATAMDAKGKEGREVFDILCQSAKNEHPIGRMGNHVICSLFQCEKQEGWELMEKTLLAAQRQEGLRQSLVEAAQQAHPDAFIRILRMMKEENLIRFSSVGRAINNWFGLLWDSVSVKVLSDYSDELLEFLQSPAKRRSALAPKDASEAESAYRALWATAYFNSEDAIKPAQKLLGHPAAEVRYVAVWLLSQLGLDAVAKVKQPAIDDEHLQVAVVAALSADGMNYHESFSIGETRLEGRDTFRRLENLYQRLSDKPQTLKAIVWPWTERKIRRSQIASVMLDHLEGTPPTKMLPYMKGLDSWQYARLIALMDQPTKWDRATRNAIFELAGHASSEVRSSAFEVLKDQTLSKAERELLEGYLKRVASDLRDSCIRLLRTGRDQDVLASAQRLLAAGDKARRLAGLEMLRRMAEEDQARNDCQRLASAYASQRKKLLKEEQTQLDSIAASSEAKLTLDNGLGLMDPTKRSPPPKLTKQNVVLDSRAVTASAKELDALVHKHRKDVVILRGWYGTEEKPLGECRSYDFGSINFSKPIEPQWQSFPLHEVWQDWFDKRSAKLKDKDGRELLRLHAALHNWDEYGYEAMAKWCRKAANKRKAAATLGNLERPKLRYEGLLSEIVEWLFLMNVPSGAVDFYLDCSENALAQVDPEAMKTLLTHCQQAEREYEYYDSNYDDPDWRKQGVYTSWMTLLQGFEHRTGVKLTKTQFKRMWGQKRFLDEPAEGIDRKRIDDYDAWVRAVQEKLVNRDDIIDAMIGPQRGEYGGLLGQLTARSKFAREAFEKCEGLEELVDEVRDRVLEVELARGEGATVSSKSALEIKSIPGIDWLFRILDALGKDKFRKNNSWNKATADIRAATLTELIAATFPLESDTQAEFGKCVKRAIADGCCDEDRLLQLAFLAPQWSKLIEGYLKWAGFREGIYWFIAHMDTWGSGAEGAAASTEGAEFQDDEDEAEQYDEDDDDSGDSIPKPQSLSPWQKLVLERTPLTDGERREGAVDVSWFHRTWKVLGTKRWKQMAEAAKFAANSAQARKAQFLADVLLGNTKKSELVTGIKHKRLKDHVRLLGLLPLEKGAKAEKDVQDRYEVLLEYRKYARTLSGLTKPDALRALEIGTDNLARLAGYPDPLRLEWALEADAVKDLAMGPVSVTKDGVTVTLSINEDAKPELMVQRGEKRLKSVPAAIRKKHQAIAELNERGKELRKKSSRIKQSLESAMCRSDEFTGAELLKLSQHAILAPHLERLVLVGEGIMGYPDKGGKALRDYRGKLEPVKKTETLRIAHPADLLASKKWAEWQGECFQAERVQPFKQVFRELYVATAQEKKEKQGSSRFAGQQIGPRQAMALWGSRGWNTRDEVFKTFHKEEIIAEVFFQWDYGTAAEIEGLTVETVAFRRTDEYKPLPIAKVPPHIFSEVMRDVDLVVSVAHRGEVDPEASASTVEMRARLTTETCKLLGIKNVKVDKSYAFIDGDYAEYSLHLGSGNVQRVPGGALAILPVHAQHRGRLFLPFADDDPRTAEVLSKVLLLARDGEIQDPLILDQLAVPVSKRKITLPDVEPKTKTTKSQDASKGTAGKARTFEFDDGKSQKFWKIEISGNDVTTSWGRIGKEGQSKTKSFSDSTSAREEYEKLVRSKVNKGYTEP